ncbi:MAG: spermidine synthase [Pseudomonadota bacterium]
MTARRPLALYGLLFLSGSAGLAYQSIWTKHFSLALGHEMPSLLGVVAAFFAGLSIGSWAFGPRMARTPNPQIWYAGCEIVIALVAVTTPFTVPIATLWAADFLGIAPPAGLHWAVAFALPFIVLLPATVAMGITLPAIEQVLARKSADNRVIAGAYAANTGGAVVGVLVSVFMALPVLGQANTLLLFAAVNVMCAVGAVAWGRADGPAIATSPVSPTHATVPSVALLLLMTGLLGVGYELLVVRLLSQAFEATLYSFATALAVYLAASSAGAALAQRFGQRWLPRLPELLLALSILSALSIGLLARASDLYRSLRLTFGNTVLDVFVSEMALALCAFALPSVLMGIVFVLLAQDERHASGHIGRALGLNTLGAALAPACIGVGLLSLIGAKWSLGLIALCYAALSVIAMRATWPRRLAVVIAPCLVLLAMPELRILTLRSGEDILAYKEGVTATVSVVQRNGARNLRVNNRYQMGGTTPDALLFQRRQAHLPLLFHPQPQTALMLGVASGTTVGAAADHRVQVDAVEIVPEVLGYLPFFAPANGSPHARPNVALYASDARRFVRTARTDYDVIIADLFHPSRDGAGLLFTEEHYQAIRDRLSDRGVFCHWLPLHQLDMDMIELVARTFLSVFPDGQLIMATDMLSFPAGGLITGLDASRVKPGYLSRRVSSSALRDVLKRDLLTNELQILSTRLFDTEALSELAGAGPLNTDDRTQLSYLGPRFTYDRESVPYGRLMTLLETTGAVANRERERRGSSDFGRRLSNYVRARDLYLNAARVHGEKDGAAALPLYLASARASRDYQTVYAQLFRLANQWADARPTDAREIARTISTLRPDVAPFQALREKLESGAP